MYSRVISNIFDESLRAGRRPASISWRHEVFSGPGVSCLQFARAAGVLHLWRERIGPPFLPNQGEPRPAPPSGRVCRPLRSAGGDDDAFQVGPFYQGGCGWELRLRPRNIEKSMNEAQGRRNDFGQTLRGCLKSRSGSRGADFWLGQGATKEHTRCGLGLRSNVAQAKKPHHPKCSRVTHPYFLGTLSRGFREFDLSG